MDLSKFSDEDLIALKSNNLSAMSDEGLQLLKNAQQPKQDGITPGRVGELLVRGAAPVAIGAGGGALIGGAPGALAGSMAVPAADLMTFLGNQLAQGNLAVENFVRNKIGLPERQITPDRMPSELISKGMAKIGLAEPTSTGERVIEAVGSSVAGAGSQVAALSNLAKTATTQGGRQLAAKLAAEPVTQIAAAGPSAAAGQYVSEATESPVLGAGASILTGTVMGLRPQIKAKVPTALDLAEESTKLYGKASQLGVQFDTDAFTTAMGSVGKNLRKEGYTPTAYPKVTAALEELQNKAMPKDIVELQALRKIVKGAQASVDSEERRLASILLDKFDNYVLNAPDSAIVAGSKEATQAWKEARGVYSKMKKSEVFEDMLEKAKLQRSKFTQSGEENSLATELRKLADNPKKLRLFNKEEQQAIKDAAKGGTVQNLLKFYGRFAPTSGIPLTAGLTAAALDPSIALPLMAGAAGSRVAATQMRKADVRNLAEMMRAGGIPEVLQSRTGLVPTTAVRGLLSTPTATQRFIEEQNPLGF